MLSQEVRQNFENTGKPSTENSKLVVQTVSTSLSSVQDANLLYPPTECFLNRTSRIDEVWNGGHRSCVVPGR